MKNFKNIAYSLVAIISLSLISEGAYAGYAYFFLYAGLLGIPALLLIIYILYHHDSIKATE